MTSWEHYRSAAPALRDLGIACLGAGEKSGQLSPFENRVLNVFALVVISEGSGWMTFREKKIRVQAPSLIWIFPGEKHGYGPGPSGWSEHWVLFAGTGVRALEEMGCLSRSMPVVRQTHELPQSIFSSIRTALVEGGNFGDLNAASELFRLLVAAGKSSAQGINSPELGLVERLKEFAYLPLTVGQQASKLGVEVSVLRGAVKSVAGVSPKELILQERLSRAQSLLAQSNHSIEKIASLIGYDDAAYFSRLFSQKVGQPPSQFRTAHRRASLTMSPN